MARPCSPCSIMATPCRSGHRIRAEVAAIKQNRSLLANPDPVPGMIETVTQALRDALNEARARVRRSQD